MSRTRTPLLLLALVAMMIAAVAVNAETCSCSCCIGNSCSPSSAGSVAVSSCGSCDRTACANAFPTKCPGSGTSGSSSAICSSGPSYDPSVWLGDYTSSGCSQSSCCCMTSVSIAQSGSGYSVAGPLAGQCGTNTYKSYSFSTPTSNTVTYVAEGETHTATRNPSTGAISDVNARSSSCNGMLTKSGGGGGGGSTAMTVAAYSDSSCKKQLGSLSVPKDQCVSDSGDFAIGSCSGNSWTVKGFRTSSTCTGTADAVASGSDRNTCAPFADGYIRVACDGSAISPAALHSASAFVVMALAAFAAMAMRA